MKSKDIYKETALGLIPEDWIVLKIMDSPIEIIDGDRFLITLNEMN